MPVFAAATESAHLAFCHLVAGPVRACNHRLSAHRERGWEGKVVKNRLHLDVRVGTGLVGEERLAALEAECARLVALGAERVRLLAADGDNESCLVMQDIEGNEFCLD